MARESSAPSGFRNNQKLQQLLSLDSLFQLWKYTTFSFEAHQYFIHFNNSSMHGNCSLKHGHNGNGYMEKRNTGRNGADAFWPASSPPRSHPYGLVYELMSESRFHTQTQNKSRNTTFDHPTLMFTLVSCSPR